MSASSSHLARETGEFLDPVPCDDEMRLMFYIDRKLKKWDLRMGTTNTKHVAESSTDPTMTLTSMRPRGITSITRGSGRTRGLVFGLAFDSQLHVYDEATLEIVERDYAGNSRTRDMRCMSYAVKLCTVGDGEWILSGGREGSAFLWDTGHVKAETRSVDRKEERNHPEASLIEQLPGHVGLIGPVDNNRSGFVTCGEEGVIQYWDRSVD